jgi:hypothetical protein
MRVIEKLRFEETLIAISCADIFNYKDDALLKTGFVALIVRP